MCVVLPITGASPQKLHNVRSQLRSTYKGKVHFLFAVESVDDPAHALATRLCSEVVPSSTRSTEVIVAGFATDRSQKLHNQRAAVAAAAPHWPLFLFTDDDCWYHPGTIDILVAAWLADSSALLVTGYPFDVPPPKATFAALCVMVRMVPSTSFDDSTVPTEPHSHMPLCSLNHRMQAYHLPLLIAFSQGTYANHVWGGCMLVPAQHCREGGCAAGAWGQGAYSDDLNLAARAGALGKVILCPAAAVFPITLDGNCTLAQAWNYLRRQQYVLDTYMDNHNRGVNHFLWVCTVYAAAAMVAATYAAASSLAVRFRVRDIDLVICLLVTLVALQLAVNQPSVPWSALVFVLLVCGAGAPVCLFIYARLTLFGTCCRCSTLSAPPVRVSL